MSDQDEDDQEAEDDDEDDDDDDDDEGSCNYEKREYKHWNILDSFCARLVQNNVETCDASQPLPLREDGFVHRFAESLVNNTSLRHVEIAFYPYLTQVGIRSFVQAIQISSVTSLSLHLESDPWEEEDDYRYAGLLVQQVCPESMIRNLRQLSISVELNDGNMEVIGKALCNNQMLEELRISVYDVTIEGAQDLLQGIKGSEILYLSIQNPSPEVCHFLLANGILSVPTLRSVSITEESADHEWHPGKEEKLLHQGFEIASQLESLTLVLSYLDVGDLKLISSAVQGNVKLKKMELCLMNTKEAGVDGIPYLVDIVKAATHLEELAFGPHFMKPTEMKHMLNAISTHPTLKALTLESEDDPFRSNLCSRKDDPSYDGQDFPRSLRNTSAAILVNYLKKGLLQLDVIKLSFTSLQLTGIHQLVKASSTTCLKELKVRHCPEIGHKWVTFIAGALEGSKLSTLHVRGSPTKMKDGDKKETTAWKAAMEALVRAVKTNFYLHELQLFATEILQAAVNEEIDFYLDLNKFGRQLFLSNGGLVPMGLWGHVMSKHRRNSSALFYFLREQPLLVPNNVSGSHKKLGNQQETSTIEATKKRKLDH